MHNNAPYSVPATIEPKQINYFYGSNGSGKTTITKYFQSPANFPQSKIIWNSEPPEELIVFNRNFVKNSFSQNEINGVFTLGEDNVTILTEIDTLSKELERTQAEIIGQTSHQKELLAIVQKCTVEAEDIFWELKKKYDVLFPECLTGSKKTKSVFFEKCIALHERKPDPLTPPETETTLVEEYSRIYKANLEHIEPVGIIDGKSFPFYEAHELLSKKIVNNYDIKLGVLIDKLNSSDWVHNGVKYISQQDLCPFCQQPISNDLKTRLLSLFDSTYDIDQQNFIALCKVYEKEAEMLLTELKEILGHPVLNYDYGELSIIYGELELLLHKNKELLNSKLQNLSLTIELDSVNNLLEQVNVFLEKLNMQIARHNDMINNISSARDKLTVRVWAFIRSMSITEYGSYEKNISGNKKGIENIGGIINDKTEKVAELRRKIREKESLVSNTTDTIESINGLLNIFGFTGFKLEAATERGKYIIVRPDNTDAKETLSEGEYNFITFLYFYQLVKGSTSPSGINKEKIVVIDDPVSSLDSNVLFIITSLVKEIREMCRGHKYGIKQVFIFSHNIYFYKEVTFYSRKEKHADEQHFLIRKTNNVSTIETKECNPITTSYNMLWDEIKRSDPATCCNAMRRILEYYFNTIGGGNYESAIGALTGTDLQVGRSLLAFINDSSHFITDDLFFEVDNTNMDTYTRVFKEIFDKLGHISHYNMMMDIDQE